MSQATGAAEGTTHGGPPNRTDQAPAVGGATGDVSRALQQLVANVERVITGKRDVVELAVIALAASGHLLLEDVPGVGKTVLARSLARSIDAQFSRVQGAPDLLPADVTGSSIYLQNRQEFQFVPGPLFANVVLVDELNRTTPRTQAALLEAMEEHQVTVDGVTHDLPTPHFVVATQNPLEHAGTFPLPESQLDRFSIAVSVGYPSARDEASVVRAQVQRHPLEDLVPVLDRTTVAQLQRQVRDVPVADEVIAYAVRLVEATRRHEAVELGASPRATIQLVHAAQALAALRGEDFVLPDHIKRLAPEVLSHRLMLRRGVTGQEAEARRIVGELLTAIPVRTAGGT